MVAYLFPNLLISSGSKLVASSVAIKLVSFPILLSVLWPGNFCHLKNEKKIYILYLHQIVIHTNSLFTLRVA